LGRRRGELHASFTRVDDVERVTNAARTNGLILITTEDCHFCRRAREVLEALDVATREIRVDSDEAAALAARGLPLAFLPVLTDGERVIAYGRVSEKRLRKELAL
jgi:glutaredoxin